MPKTAKKAGPKRIDPNTFVPVVWRKKGLPVGDDLEFLVCKRRIYEGVPVAGLCHTEEKAADRFTHPMAIQLTPKYLPMPRLILTRGSWEFDPPTKHGISIRCAKVALAQAYHGVKAQLNLATMEPDIDADFRNLHFYKNGVRMRNLLTALHWSRWEKLGLPMKERATELQLKLGFVPWHCTEVQIKRFAAEQGL